jgi:hypothetical protein
VSKKNKSKKDKTAKSSKQAPATVAEALKAAGVVADRIIAATEPEAVADVAPLPVETTEPTAAPATPETPPAASEPANAQLAAAEAKVESLKQDLAKARAELSGLKKGPKGNAVDGQGNPLSAGKRAWLTRLARGFQPKAKAPKAPRDPNAPLTAGQKAQATRAARKADPNYQPPKPAKAKVEAKVRLDAAIGAAFPVESAAAPAAPAA